MVVSIFDMQSSGRFINLTITTYIVDLFLNDFRIGPFAPIDPGRRLKHASQFISTLNKLTLI